MLAWNGSAWVDALSMLTTIQNVALFGFGTTADATNPFSAKLNNALVDGENRRRRRRRRICATR